MENKQIPVPREEVLEKLIHETKKRKLLLHLIKTLRISKRQIEVITYEEIQSVINSTIVKTMHVYDLYLAQKHNDISAQQRLEDLKVKGISVSTRMDLDFNNQGMVYGYLAGACRNEVLKVLGKMGATKRTRLEISLDEKVYEQESSKLRLIDILEVPIEKDPKDIDDLVPIVNEIINENKDLIKVFIPTNHSKLEHIDVNDLFKRIYATREKHDDIMKDLKLTDHAFKCYQRFFRQCFKNLKKKYSYEDLCKAS